MHTCVETTYWDPPRYPITRAGDDGRVAGDDGRVAGDDGRVVGDNGRVVGVP